MFCRSSGSGATKINFTSILLRSNSNGNTIEEQQSPNTWFFDTAKRKTHMVRFTASMEYPFYMLWTSSLRLEREIKRPSYLVSRFRDLPTQNTPARCQVSPTPTWSPVLHPHSPTSPPQRRVGQRSC